MSLIVRKRGASRQQLKQFSHAMVLALLSAETGLVLCEATTNNSLRNHMLAIESRSKLCHVHVNVNDFYKGVPSLRS